jgi:hypothetical protein
MVPAKRGTRTALRDATWTDYSPNADDADRVRSKSASPW